MWWLRTVSLLCLHYNISAVTADCILADLSSTFSERYKAKLFHHLTRCYNSAGGGLACLQDAASMERSLQMKISNWSTTELAGCQWPMLGKIPTVHSFLSLLPRRNGWMDDTLSLALYWREWYTYFEPHLYNTVYSTYCYFILNKLRHFFEIIRPPGTSVPDGLMFYLWCFFFLSPHVLPRSLDWSPSNFATWSESGSIL